MTTLYTTRDDVKDRLDIGDTVDDAALDLIIEAVSREIEHWTGRRFQPVTQTRYYTAHCGWRLAVDDLLSVTTLKTDEDGDRTYERTWAGTDYELWPWNAPNDFPARPYTSIQTTPNGNYSFPTGGRAVEIAARWGYSDVRVTSTATLAEDLDASETGVDVSSGTVFKVGQTLRLDSEDMEISAISTNTLTVTRGANGSTAATHSNGAAISVYTYPIVGEAALHQVMLHMQARGAGISGTLGSSEFGAPIRQVGLHPFVTRALQRFRLPVVG